MTTIDLKKDLKQLYLPGTKGISEVMVPAMNFLMIDGAGDPNTSRDYAAALGALYTVAYTLKFAAKRGPLATDYPVMPLESLWWADDMGAFTLDHTDKNAWKWTMMILQPSFVANDVIALAISEVRRKKNLPAISKLRLETFEEGRCAQVLHIGPFSEEGRTIQRVHEYINARTSVTGKHHEIYLSDIRRAAPQKWKTIIRQPMR